MKILKRMITMKQMYSNLLLGDGILSDLSDFSVPWNEDVTNGDISTTFLDMGYYTRSARKIVAPFILDIAGITNPYETPTPLTTEQRTKIAGILYNIFHRKWERIWNLSLVEYNPISNYDMTETESIGVDIHDVRSNTGTITNVTDDTLRETGTVTNVIDTDTSQTGTVSYSGTNSVDNDIFGFNSSTAVGSNSSDGSVSTTRTDNLHGTDDTTDTRTDNLTKDRDITDTETRNVYDNLTGDRDTQRELTRSGNIGVTTSQQMVRDELEVWQWNYFQMVFEDIDSICCLEIY